jgi:hypothetical protein
MKLKQWKALAAAALKNPAIRDANAVALFKLIEAEPMPVTGRHQQLLLLTGVQRNPTMQRNLQRNLGRPGAPR